MSRSGFKGQGDAWEAMLAQMEATGEITKQALRLSEENMHLRSMLDARSPPTPIPACIEPRRSEHDEAAALMKLWALSRWSTLHPGRLIHLDTGRATRAQNGRKKAEGSRKGTPDYLLFVARAERGLMPPYHGLFFELKAPGGRASTDQIAFLRDVRAEGYAGEVVWGGVDAFALVEAYLDCQYLPTVNMQWR